MSSFYYSTMLRFMQGHTGLAKLHGHEVMIDHQPVLCGHAVDVEYAPEIRLGRVKEQFGGWRDMQDDEIHAADVLLHELVPE